MAEFLEGRIIWPMSDIIPKNKRPKKAGDGPSALFMPENIRPEIGPLFAPAHTVHRRLFSSLLHFCINLEKKQ